MDRAGAAERESPTQVLSLSAQTPDPAIIARAAAVIRAGGLVAFPTETVYGLGADALSAEAVAGIYRAKRRSLDDPCIVHLATSDEVARVADLTSPLAAQVARLAARFWPGPLSLVLPRAAAVPDVVTAGRPTVAVRVPAHAVPLALIRAAGVPLAAPSANLFMHTSPTTAAHVWDDLAGRIALILDAGSTSVGVESTVLDLSGAVPTVLRHGGVSMEQLETVLDRVVASAPATGDPGEGGALPAPGMLHTHYAPYAELLLFGGTVRTAQVAMATRAREAVAAGRRVGVLLLDEDAALLTPALPPDVVVARLGAEADAAVVAQRLFAALRELERQGVEVIVARTVDPSGVGRAINDRLTRAAGSRLDVGSATAERA